MKLMSGRKRGDPSTSTQSSDKHVGRELDNIHRKKQTKKKTCGLDQHVGWLPLVII